MAKRRKKILVIAPHADDEILGCGGYLLHQTREGAEIVIVIGTIGGTDVRQPFDKRMGEFKSVCAALNAKWIILYKGLDAILDTVSSFELTTKIDKIVDGFKPDEVFINALSRHQDHVKLYNCAIASMRLREGYEPQMIALYEYPFTLQGYEMPAGGKVYHNISDVIEEKIKLFELYKTQIREKPSPLNRKGITALAAIRGLENGCDYSEMFYLQKMKI